MKLVGGYPGYYTGDNYQTWVDTVPLNPIIVRSDIIPITDLVENKSIRDVLVKALENYYISPN